MTITLLRNFFWWCSGVNIGILSKFESDWNRYTNLGAISFISSLSSTLSTILLCSYFANPFVSILIGVILGATVLSLNRLLLISSSDKKRYIIVIAKFALAIVVTFLAVLAISLTMFKNEINEFLKLKGTSLGDSFAARIAALSEIIKSHAFSRTTFWVLAIFLLLIEFNPVMARMLMRKGSYEIGLEMHRVTELQKREISTKSEIEEFTLELEKKIEKKKELGMFPFGGVEVYIDYKRLLFSDINSIFDTIGNLYSAIYIIERTQVENVSHKENSFDTTIFKTHPEDALYFHSIETGNSITFKVTTGWKPRVELLKGDFVIYLPKGGLSLLIFGFIASKIFDFGVSNLKEALEIKQIKKENRKLDIETEILKNQLLKEQIGLFKSAFESAPIGIREKLQKEYFKLYELTIGNENLRHTRLIFDDKIFEKLKKGELMLRED
jgi:hypothetical protein